MSQWNIKLGTAYQLSLLLLGVSLLILPRDGAADGSWFVLPIDQEISQAGSEYALAETKRIPLPVAPGTDKEEAQRHYSQISYSVVKSYKMHNKSIADPVQASEAFVLFKAVTKEVRDKQTRELIGWVVARLSFGKRGNELTNRYHFVEGVFQNISPSPPSDQEIVDWIKGFLRAKYQNHLGYNSSDEWLPGFAGDTPKQLSKPICPEAIEYFKQTAWWTTKDTHIRKDLNELKADMKKGIDCYQRRHPDSPAYASLPVANSNLEVGIWLFGYGGGGKQTIIDRFSFTDTKLTTDIAVAQKTGALQRGEFKAPPRSEAALLQEIIKAYDDPDFKNHKPLSPGDVLCLALEQTKGDLRFATLLAHNTLRAVGRGGEGDGFACGLDGSPELFSKYLETIRGGPVPGIDPKNDPLANDNSGVWYHMFGTAFFELQTKADLGLSQLQYMWNPPPDEFLELMKEGAKIDKADRTSWSRFANQMEQIYRKYFDAQPDDPEKYCFNLWGAQIASMLFQDMADRKQLRLAGMGPNDPEPADSRDTGKIKISFDDLEGPDLTEKVRKQFLNSPFNMPGQKKIKAIFSPVNVIWEMDGKSLELNQASGFLRGSLPIAIFPFWEERGNWGAVWLDPPEGNYNVSMQGTSSGVLHVFHLDLSNGSFAAFVDTVNPGQKLSMAVSHGLGVPLLKREDGSAIKPVTNSSVESTEEVSINSSPEPQNKIPTAVIGGKTNKLADKVLLSDNFDNKLAKMLYDPEVDQPAYGNRGYRSGEYFIKNDQPQSGAASVPVGGTYTDAVLIVDARIVGQSTDNLIALTCRFNFMEFGMYRLSVIPDEKTIRLTRFDGPKETLLGEERNSVVKPGNGWNHLEMSCVGDTLTVRVNETQILSVKDTTYSAGSFSIGIGSKNKDLISEAVFDNLTIRGVD